MVMVGAYGVGEVLTRLETGFATKPIDKISNARTELPTLKELNDIKGMFFALQWLAISSGLLPGAGATIASFVSYRIEARFGKRKGADGDRDCRRDRRAAGGGDGFGWWSHGSFACTRYSRQRRNRSYSRRIHAARDSAGPAGSRELRAACSTPCLRRCSSVSR